MHRWDGWMDGVPHHCPFIRRSRHYASFTHMGHTHTQESLMATVAHAAFTVVHQPSHRTEPLHCIALHSTGAVRCGVLLASDVCVRMDERARCMEQFYRWPSMGRPVVAVGERQSPALSTHSLPFTHHICLCMCTISARTASRPPHPSAQWDRIARWSDPPPLTRRRFLTHPPTRPLNHPNREW